MFKLCSFNCRSVYGREVDLIRTMRSHQISLLLLQETKHHANVPPTHLDPAIYQQHSTAGIRGLITKPDQQTANAISLTDLTEPATDHYLWTDINTLVGTLHVANCYFSPDKQEKQCNIHALGKLFNVVQYLNSLPGPAHIILCGDFNADPLISRNYGYLAEHIRTLLEEHGLCAMPRPQHNSCTRPASGKHIDHFFVSRSLFPFIKNELIYLTNNTIGASASRTKSDHTPLILTLSRVLVHPQHKISVRINLKQLRSGGHNQYAAATHALSIAWFRWRRSMPFPLSPTAIDALWEGLSFLLFEAAHLALGKAATQPSPFPLQMHVPTS